MAVSISAPVGFHGRKGGNRPADVAAIHGLLAGIPAAKGGPGPGFKAGAGYSAQTDQAIFNFQKANRLTVQDATVNPGQTTLSLMNQLSSQPGTSPPGYAPPAPPTSPPPGYSPPPSTGPGPDVAPLRVLARMTETIVGHAYVKGFDNIDGGQGLGRFRVPMYRLTLGRADENWAHTGFVADFNVIRFGVHLDSRSYTRDPNYKWFRMQGPPKGSFSLSKSTYLTMSWKITGSYYIHDGPDSPLFKSNDEDLKLVGALGCIELCGPGQLTAFFEYVRMLSFGDFYDIGFLTGDEADERITKAQSFRLVVDPATTPPLVPLTDFRSIGGPAPVAG